MDGNNREMIRRAYWRNGVSLGVTMHVCDRATKHERQGKGKKDFADDFCFHVNYSICLFICLFVCLFVTTLCVVRSIHTELAKLYSQKVIYCLAKSNAAVTFCGHTKVSD